MKKMNLYGLILIIGIFYQSDFVFCRKKVVCYWANWSVNRRGSGQHKISKINSNLCTHLVYAYAGIDNKGNITSMNPIIDIKRGGYNDFNHLKLKSPHLKTMLSVGGPSLESSFFSEMTRSKKSRSQFIKSTIELLNEYDFDGLDINWEYPTQLNGNIKKDRDNFIQLLRDIKEHFSRNHKKLILSAAITSDIKIIQEAYHIKPMCLSVNFLNLKAYDMNYLNVTSFQAPLRRVKGDFKEKTYIKQIINYLRDNGCSLKKIVLGIPAYGRTYTLKNSNKHDLGEPVIGPGPKGPYTQEDGYLGYNEICLYQRRQLGWTHEVSKWKGQIYAWRHKLWISYDSPITVRIKAKYVQRKNLGGLMFWSIDTDDFEGICSSVKYPLLKAAKKALRKNENKTKNNEMD